MLPTRFKSGHGYIDTDEASSRYLHHPKLLRVILCWMTTVSNGMWPAAVLEYQELHIVIRFQLMVGGNGERRAWLELDGNRVAVFVNGELSEPDSRIPNPCDVTEDAEQAVFANQLRTVDALLFEEYVKAFGEDKQPLVNFLFQRFRPEMKVATEAWLATCPQENPAAPPTRFAMPEYSLAADKEATQLRDEEEKTFAAARAANEISDAYLLLTVLYSLALFLSGIATAFKRHRLKMVVLALAVMVMIVTAVRMVFLPLAAA